MQVEIEALDLDITGDTKTNTQINELQNSIDRRPAPCRRHHTAHKLNARLGHIAVKQPRGPALPCPLPAIKNRGRLQSPYCSPNLDGAIWT